MVAQNIIFGILAFVQVVAAIRLVTTNNVVHSALFLVIVLSGMAAQYILLAAEFIAVAQVLVYIGAVTVLILFGVMLTRAPIGVMPDLNHGRRLISALVSLFLFGALGALLVQGFKGERLSLTGSLAVNASGGNMESISDALFSTYLIPFEVTSILLLAALVGAVAVARRD